MNAIQRIGDWLCGWPTLPTELWHVVMELSYESEAFQQRYRIDTAEENRSPPISLGRGPWYISI